jgi:hypothetical protein
VRLPTQRKLSHEVIAIDWVISRSPYPHRQLANSQLPSVVRAKEVKGIKRTILNSIVLSLRLSLLSLARRGAHLK